MCSVLNKQFQASILSFALLLLAACSPMETNRGHIEESGIYDQVKAGETSKDGVLRLLGSPSSISSFGEETWYYISMRKEAQAFLRPEIKDQHVFEVMFDARGLVKGTKEYSLKDGKQVQMVSETTPTEGHSLSFMEQVMGNVGRFNKERDRTLNPGNARR